MFSLGDGMEWPESDNFLRFLHPYTDPTFMFTRWTVRVSASGVDFGGDDAETVADDVHAELGSDVERKHVSARASEDGNTVSVFIEDVTAEDLQSALESAGYSAESYTGREQPFTEFMEIADNAWNEYYSPNKGPGEEAQAQRNRAYRIIEEVNWASVQELPTTHGITQRFQQQRVNVRMAGTMEEQTLNTLTLEDQ
jgi:hypothetical protein